MFQAATPKLAFSALLAGGLGSLAGGLGGLALLAPALAGKSFRNPELRKSIMSRKDAIRDEALAVHAKENPAVYARAQAGDMQAQRDLDYAFEVAERKGKTMAVTLPLLGASVLPGAAVGAAGAVGVNHMLSPDEDPNLKIAFFPSEGLALGALGGGAAGLTLSRNMGPLARVGTVVGGTLAGGATGAGVDVLRQAKDEEDIRRDGARRQLAAQYGVPV